MKKLSLKKTTLSRLNNETLSNVRGGVIVKRYPDTDYNICGITHECQTGSACYTAQCHILTNIC
ncbi:class I lanthipeptide [Labilibaculum euxinus]|uniref:class I lanthipeptide n=1 Tax=Labilibaculum euxinus TaxID=2686357 RepID=UPI0018CF6384